MKISTLYKLPLFLMVSFLFVSLMPGTIQAQAWYNVSWAYRKAITIDYTKVGSGPHTNIPVLISRADTDLQTAAQADGDDILFTSSDGTTKIAHEIESYTSASGTIVAWVEIPSLSSSANTVIYMYYGNAAAVSQQNRTGTWDANFRGVYHLNGAFADATSNAYNGTNTGTYDMPGKISQGRGFNPRDGGADNIAITGLMGSPASVTLSAWVYRSSAATESSMIVSLGDKVNIMRTNTAASIDGNYYNGTTWLGTPTNTNYDNGWHYAVYTYLSGGSSQKIYIDGILVNSTTNAAAIAYAGLGADTRIGSHANGSAAFDFDGNLDEVRVASAARSVGWILTEYNNQNSPSTFYSTGAQISYVKTFTGIGNFSTAARWSGGTVPVAGENIIIDGTCTVDNNAGTDNVVYGTLTIGTATGRTLNWAASGTNRLNVTSVNAGAGASTLDMTNGGTMILRGTWTSTNLSFTAGTGTIDVRAALTLPAAYTTYNHLIINASGLTVGLGAVTTVNGNLTVTAGTFTANNLNSTIGGNWVNNGTFTAGTGTITFTGASNTTVTGSSTTAFNRITVDKGTTSASVLDVQSLITMLADGLRILDGTFKLSSNSTITPWTAEIATAPYNIPSTGGLWVNGGTVSTTSQISFAGLVRSSAGILNIGDAIDERFYLRPGSASIIVDGGTVNVASRLSYANATDVMSFNMSSGTFNAGTAGNIAGVAPFTIFAAASSFTMSGGTIVIVKSAGSNAGYYNGAGTSNVTGGTLQIGNASTPAADSMYIYSTTPIWNLTINNTNAPEALLSTDLVVYNDLTISGGKLNANNLNLTVGGDWINNGTFIPGAATVSFNGTTIMSGTTVTNTFNNLTVAASSSVTSSTGITGLVVNGTLTTGASAILDLGTTTILSGTLGTVSNSGTIETAVPSTTSATPIPSGKTWGGTIDYNNGGANQTIIGGTYNNLTVRPGNGRTATATGNLVVNGILTVTTAFGAFDLSIFILSGALTSIANSGDIRTSVPTTTSATPIPAGKTWNGTVYYNAIAGAQTITGGTFNIIRFSNTSGTNIAAGDLTVNNQFVTTAGGTLDMGASYRIINMGGAITNNGTVKTSVLTSTSSTPFPAGKTWGGTGTVEYAALTGAQTIMSGTYYNLKLSNTSGTNTASGNITAGGIFTLTGGTITTASYTLYLNSTGSVSRTSGHVIGNFQKYIATGATTKIFEIGDATNYTPVTIVFASVTTAGDLTASTATGDHANIGTATINPAKSINRTWTFSNTGIVFTNFGATFTFTAGDIDAGAATNSFIVGRYSAGWTYPTVGTKTSTSTQATGLGSFGNFQLGEYIACSPPAAPTVTSPVNYCQNATAVQLTATGSNLIWNTGTTSGTVGGTSTLTGNNYVATDVNNNRKLLFTTTADNVTITTVDYFVDTWLTTNSLQLGIFDNSGNLISSSSTITSAPSIGSNAKVTNTFNYIIAVAGNYSIGIASGFGNLAGETPGFPITEASGTINITGVSPGIRCFNNIQFTKSGSPTAPTPPTTAVGTINYTVSQTVAGCISPNATIAVVVSAAPTASAAGADQTGSATCGLTTVTLAANAPSVGTGAWSIVSGIAGTVTTPSSATSTFTGTAGTAYVLRWTISNSPCTASTDDVSITFNRNPTTSAAGADQTGLATCGLTTVTLAANAASLGTGAWSIVSGTGGTVTTPSSATSTFTGTAGTAYVLRWTISNSPCTASTDDVSVTFNRNPTVSAAGADQTGSATCGLTIVTLAANAASVGTGAWSIVSGTGGTVTTPSSATSTFTGTAGTAYVLRWTISNSPCTASTDDIGVTFNRNPTVSAAGADQTGLATCGLTTVTLAANAASVGTGAWSIVSGTGGTVTTPTSATSTFTGTAGTGYVLRWTISNSPCTASTDDVSITFNQNPTTSAAGADQTGTATCGLTTVTLAANAASMGTGAWSIVSGTGGTVTTPSSATSTFTGTAGTAYVLRWTISNSPCTASTDDVSITFNQNPTTSAAGADQTGLATCGLTTVTLAANAASVGTGAWSIVSGTGGTVTTPTSATSTFTGTAGTAYVLRWTISNSPCTASTDDVSITFNQNPTTSAAGADQVGAATCGLTTVTLGGNTATTGTGAWSIVSGTGGTVTTPSSAISTFSGTAGTSYTLRWTISNPPCISSADDVVISLNQISNNQIDYTNGTMGVLCSTPGEGGTATLTAPAGMVFIHVGFASYGTPGGSCNAFTLGTCNAVTSRSVAQTYFLGNNTGSLPATNAIFGDPCNGTVKRLYVQATYTQPICSGTSPGTFTGTSPTGGDGAYSYLWEQSTTSSTSGFSPATGTNNTKDYTPGILTQTTWYKRTVTSGPCTNISGIMQVTVTPAPAAAISYAGTPFCTSVSSGQAVTQTGTAGGTYSSTAGLTINAGTGDITPSTSTAGTYTVTYTVAAAGGCSVYTTTTSITITTQPFANGYYAGTPYCSTGGIAFPTGTSSGASGVLSSTAGLSINPSNGVVNLGASTTGDYIITYTVTASGGCALYQNTTDITIVTPGTWTGAVSTAWNTSGNWLCGAIPTGATNIIIPGSLGNYPVLNTGTATVQNVTIQSGGSLTVTGATLQIAGSISNSGTFTTTNGSIVMNGSSAQTIPAALFSGNTIKSLTVNNSAGVTLGGTLSLTEVLTVSNGTFATGGYLTLKSTPAATARIASLPVDGTGTATSFITGNVAVERYIPSKRAWRLVTAPLSNTGSVYNSWQNGGIYEAGKGVFVTGPSPSAPNGLDGSTLNTVSMKSYDFTTQAFSNITNTKTSNLSNNSGSAANIGYFLFVRGDRDPNNFTLGYSNSTTLKSAGILQTGKQVFSASGTYGYFSIMGNPYASPVDFNNLQRTHLLKRFYAWDATLNQTGAYVVLDDIDGDGTFSKSVPSSLQDKNIQSGQAFYVITDTVGAAGLTYYETSKSTGSSNAGFRPRGLLKSMDITLNLREADNSTSTADAVIAEFNDNFCACVNLQDAVKFSNTNETISLLRNGTSLAIERRPLINLDDTLFIKLTRSTQRNYQLLLDAGDLAQPNLVAFLEDAYTGIATPVLLTGVTAINFTIDANAASINSDRFRVVFKQAGVLPVTYSEVNAWQQGNDIMVGWKVENQLNIRHYEVERSTDGLNFTKVYTLPVNGANTASGIYNWLDREAAPGDNFYRIRNVDLDGTAAYSKVVKVNMGKRPGTMVVYPNPVTGGVITLQLTNMPAGKYHLRLMNTIGQVLLVKDVIHAGGSTTEKLRLTKEIANGLYKLEIANPDNDNTIINVAIQ